MPALKRLVNTFRLAAHFNDEPDVAPPSSKKGLSRTAKSKSAKLKSLELKFAFVIPSTTSKGDCTLLLYLLTST